MTREKIVSKLEPLTNKQLRAYADEQGIQIPVGVQAKALLVAAIADAMGPTAADQTQDGESGEQTPPDPASSDLSSQDDEEPVAPKAVPVDQSEPVSPAPPEYIAQIQQSVIAPPAPTPSARRKEPVIDVLLANGQKSYWRCGHNFTNRWEEIPLSKFSEAAWAKLRKDKNLKVRGLPIGFAV